MTKAVVLLSAGLDSAFNLMSAQRQYAVELAITFDYGQKAATREMERARQLCEYLKINHRVVALPWFKDFTNTALIGNASVPRATEINIENLEVSAQSAAKVWVPNRNGIFLNIAAGFAEGFGAEVIVPGFNLEEAQTFPDNSEAFMRSLNNAFSFSTANRVRVQCYSTHLNKTQIVAEAIELSLPLQLLWPCYLGEENWCGTCESCQRFKRAVVGNGLNFENLRDGRSA